MLQLDSIHTYYGESHVLYGVSLKVEEGSVIALLGRNGMGKTTTIHSIIGITPPSQGRIIFKGKDITRLQPYQIPQTGLALVPQGRRIFPFLSVKENLTIAAKPSKKSEEGWTLEKIYSLFPLLHQRSGFRGNLLSGGEQQMLAIGRGLMTNPDMLLMDEPSEGLAPLIVREFTKVINELHKSGLSILLVEQNLKMALAVADYIYILSKGKTVHESSPSDLRNNKDIISTYLSVAASSKL
jgi:branched-chain amino acid transport system ATP-binding protein